MGCKNNQGRATFQHSCPPQFQLPSLLLPEALQPSCPSHSCQHLPLQCQTLAANSHQGFSAKTTNHLHVHSWPDNERTMSTAQSSVRIQTKMQSKIFHPVRGWKSPTAPTAVTTWWRGIRTLYLAHHVLPACSSPLHTHPGMHPPCQRVLPKRVLMG